MVDRDDIAPLLLWAIVTGLLAVGVVIAFNYSTMPPPENVKLAGMLCV